MSAPNEAGEAKGLAELEEQVHRDLDRVAYPARPWVRPGASSDGQPILEVLIIGGGQGGLAVAFGLQRERVDRVLIVDENDKGAAGPWRTFARMQTLRTPKYVTGPDLGIPSLTARAWYEAQHGADAWEKLAYLPRSVWADYLDWYRELLKLPVRHKTRAGALTWLPSERCFSVPLSGEAGDEVVLARKIVLATGIEGSGRWTLPPEVAHLPSEVCAHTRHAIDFARLEGKRIGVLGAAASAFDNASVALEAGAAEVHLFHRREKLPNVDPMLWAEFVGFLRHHADLPDRERWRFILQILRMGQLPPPDAFERATSFPGFHLHAASPWTKAEQVGSGVRVTTPKGGFDFDFVIAGTGFSTDLSLRPELARVNGQIALWRDCFTPAPGQEHDELSRYPYLGPSFELTEKTPGAAPYLSSIFNYTFGSLPSLGYSGASISGMKYSVPRLVGGITRQLYAEDADYHYQALREYGVE